MAYNFSYVIIFILILIIILQRYKDRIEWSNISFIEVHERNNSATAATTTATATTTTTTTTDIAKQLTHVYIPPEKGNNILRSTNPNNFELALYTFNFGVHHDEDKLLNSRNYFFSHLRSIENIKNTTILYITNIIESHIHYPSNAHVVLIQWHDLIRRLEIFLNRPFPNLMTTTSYYKVCDFKPIFPQLYPELFERYKWIGWIDNDMWLSSNLIDLVSRVSVDPMQFAIHFLEHDYVKNSKSYSWGPITILKGDFYRKEINRLLYTEKIQNVLIQIFRISVNTNFAEWGSTTISPAALGWSWSFSRVLHDIFSTRKDISVAFAKNYYQVGMSSDYISCVKHPRGHHCGNCLLTVDKNVSKIYTAFLDNPSSDREVLMCHFEAGKKQKENKTSNFKMNDLLDAEVFSSGWREGLRLYRNIDDFKKMLQHINNTA